MEKSINTPTTSLRGEISRMKPNSMITSFCPETSGSQSPFPRIRKESMTDTAPLTIFYNGGTVTVFDLPKEKAKNIIKFAERGVIPKIVEPSDTTAMAVVLLDTLSEDLPIARKKSLQRFLEKRKERLTSVSPLASTRNPHFQN